MVDIAKYIGAVSEAYDCHKIGDTLEETWARREVLLTAALTALADEAAGEMREASADRCEEQQCRICGDLDSDCRCRSPLPEDHLIEATGWACARAIRAIPLPSERK